ncbi:MAG: hypothetical protein ACYS21_20090 [Planctomycetota bacterium]|jgi:hypothetical protein
MALEFPTDRPGTYDEDLVYDETTDTWTSGEDLLRQGGSRYQTQLVVIAKDLIYYEERT